MLRQTQLLWISLLLLLATYITLGSLMSTINAPWDLWLLVIVAVLLMDVALSSSWSKVRAFLSPLFKSDTRALITAAFLAFLSVIILTWLNISTHIIVVLCTGTLVKLDAQKAQLSQKQTFWMMLVVSLVGLAVGAVAQTLFLSHL